MTDSQPSLLHSLALEAIRDTAAYLDAPHVLPWAEGEMLPALGLAADICAVRLAEIFGGIHGPHLGTEVFDRLMFLANEIMQRARDASDENVDLCAVWANRLASAAYSLTPKRLFDVTPPQHAAYSAAAYLVPLLDRIDQAMLAYGTVSEASAKAVAEELGLDSVDASNTVIFQIKGEGKEAASILVQAIPLQELVTKYGPDMLRAEWWCERHARALRLMASTATNRKLPDPPEDAQAFLLEYLSSLTHS